MFLDVVRDLVRTLYFLILKFNCSRNDWVARLFVCLHGLNGLFKTVCIERPAFRSPVMLDSPFVQFHVCQVILAALSFVCLCVYWQPGCVDTILWRLHWMTSQFDADELSAGPSPSASLSTVSENWIIWRPHKVFSELKAASVFL